MNLWLPAASANAPEVDHLIWALLGISIAVLSLVFGLMLLYMFKYRAGSKVERGALAQKSWRLEWAWTAATLLAFFGLFVWGADLYIRLFQPPPAALRIYVIGKQWMWKMEHIGGEREINALHVPIDMPIELVMTSEDVIHDFSIPAFRVKHDVLPGRYETLWFEAKTPGSYHLFCTQFCGIDHAHMTGEVVAMTQPDFERWLQQNDPGDTLAATGAKLYMHYGCSGCHGGNGAGAAGAAAAVADPARAPRLSGLFGALVPLAGGTTIEANDQYLRDAILNPAERRVVGYRPIMPSFAGLMSEEDLINVIAYIKSLGAGPAP
jgi:cytochrome c oxidase subunit 2